MPKLFSTILLIAIFAKLNPAFANVGSCPAPATSDTDLSLQEHPSADIYHQSMQQAVERANQTLDWVIDPDSDSLCGGYYQSADNPNPQQNIDPEHADIILSADSATKTEDGFTKLQGNVELYHGNRRIRCDVMRYSDSTQYSDASGNLQLRQPGLLLISDKAKFDNLNKTSEFRKTEYVLHNQQAHGKANKIHLDASNNNAILTLRESSFTVCPPTAELWSFDARKLEIDYNEGWGKMYSAFFKVADVPIVYVPYIDFPIDKRRKTGLLWPSFSSAEHGGIDATIPYYFNIAPQADLTYIPHYNSDHGTLHGVEARYKQRYAEWTMGGTYLGNDERVGDVLVSSDPTLDNERWLGFIQEKGRFNANWSTEVNYQAVSDINYYRDWGSNGFDIQKALNIRRFATLNYSDAKWKASTTVIDYQALEIDPATQKTMIEDYSRLPIIDVLYRNGQENFALHPLFFGQYSFFDHTQRIRSQRTYLNPGLQLPMRWQGGEIIPNFRVKYRQFNLNDSNDIADVQQANTVYQGKHDTTAPSFTLNNRLFFERDTMFGGNSYTETLTPRLFYYYADYEDQSHLPNFDTIETAFSYEQLFRDTRFGSFDRIGDANQLSAALESGLIRDDNGSKLFSLGLGQIFYFQDRRVTAYRTDNIFRTILPTDTADIVKEKKLINQEIDKRYYREYSDVALEPTWYIDNNQRLSSSLIWDPKQTSTQEAAIGYHYRDENQTIFNISYRYKQNPYFISKGEWFTLNDIDQTDISTYFPINKNWRGYMRWNFDITNNKTIEDITGVKYESCCVGVMFAYQRERKTFDNNIRIADTIAPSYDYTWFIQFELKGLGGITNSITTLLEESIQGFKQRETQF